MQIKTHTPSRSSIEVLEARVAPAGLVTVTFAGGVLTVEGDADDNSLTFAVGALIDSAESYIVSGNSGTQIALNGAAAASGVSIFGAVKSIVTKLNAGNDSVTFGGFETGAVSIDGGDGNDTIILDSLNASGPVTIKTGIGNDSVAFGGSYCAIGGNLTVDLGDGLNGFFLSANDTRIDGAVALTGGSGVDSIFIGGASTVLGSTLTAKLGGDANTFGITSQAFELKSNLVVEHLTHGTAVSNTISTSSGANIGGGITINNGDGGSTTSISSSGRIAVKGLVKITSGTGSDTINSSGTEFLLNGGLAVDSGDGSSNTSISTNFLSIKSVSIKGGANDDFLNLSGGTVRTGAVTIDLGNGSNSFSMNGGDISVSGAVKVTSGTGDDNLGITANFRTTIKGGITVDAGDGVNAFSSNGGLLETSTISVKLGAHAASTSSSTLGNSNTVAKSYSVTSLDGAEQISIFGTAVIGKVNLALGGGTNAVSTSGMTQEFGTFTYSGGDGNDTVNVGGSRLSIGTFKSSTGNGNNSTNFSAQVIGFSAPITVASGNGTDSISLNSTNMRLVGGIKANLGDGPSTLSISASGQLVSGAISLVAGDAGAGANQLQVTSSGQINLAAIAASYAGGTSATTINSAATVIPGGVKIKGSAGSDTVTVGGSSSLITSAVSTDLGDGVNNLFLSSSFTKIAAITHTGGVLDDNVTVVVGTGSVGSLSLDLKAGTHSVNVFGSGAGKLGSAKILAANSAAQTGTISLTSLNVGGAATFTLGDGANTLNVANSIFKGAFTAAAGGGADTVSIDNTSNGDACYFNGAVSINLGEGDDALNIGLNSASGKGVFKGAVKIDGAGGNDTTNVSATTFGNIYPAGQPVISNVETQN